MGKFRREVERLPPDVRLRQRLALALEEAATQARLQDRPRQDVELRGLSPAEYALVTAWLLGRQPACAALTCCLTCGGPGLAESGCVLCRPSGVHDAPLH